VVIFVSIQWRAKQLRMNGSPNVQSLSEDEE